MRLSALPGITLTVVGAVMLGRQLEPDATQVGLPAGGRFSKTDRYSLLGLLVLIAGAILLFTKC